MHPLKKIFCLYFGRTVTVFLDGAPAVTAAVIEIEHNAVRLTAISGSTISIPFDQITAVQGFPPTFPPVPPPP